jgi:hypothetical protein
MDELSLREKARAAIGSGKLRVHIRCFAALELERQ